MKKKLRINMYEGKECEVYFTEEERDKKDNKPEKYIRNLFQDKEKEMEQYSD